MRPVLAYKLGNASIQMLSAFGIRGGNLSFRLEHGFDQRRHPVWIPRRHRYRSLRHTVIQMPMNNGFEFLDRLIRMDLFVGF